MKTKVLNLDEVEVTVAKEFTWKDKVHQMKPLSVGDFIVQTKAVEELTAKNPTETEAVEFMLSIVRMAFPTLSDEDARAMDLKRLEVLVEFVREGVETEAAEGNAQ